jgi:hypothetical protein
MPLLDGRGLHPPEAKRPKIQLVDEDVDHPDRLFL